MTNSMPLEMPSPSESMLIEVSRSLFTRVTRPFASTKLAELRGPACAIGGITLDRAPTLIAAGADLLAVISDLFNAPDITARAAAYQHLFEEPHA